MEVYARSLPGCRFAVICLGLILPCSSLIYMDIIWFTCSTPNDIIMICKLFVLISLYKKVKMKLIIKKETKCNLESFLHRKTYWKEIWSRKTLQFSHFSFAWNNLIAENIWSILVTSDLSFLNCCR